MLEGLHRLLELQRLDDELFAEEREQADLPSRRAELEESRAAREAAVVDAREALEAAEVQQRREEALLQDQEALLRKLEGHQLQVKSNEAYTALLHEMDRARQMASDSETRILECMDAIEGARTRLAAADVAARETGARVEADLRAIDAREEWLGQQISRLREAREQLCTGIDAPLLARYAKVAARRRPAVVVVTKEMCMGCRVDIPPQHYIEILRGQTLVTCENCQRVLVHGDHVGGGAA